MAALARRARRTSRDANGFGRQIHFDLTDVTDNGRGCRARILVQRIAAVADQTVEIRLRTRITMGNIAAAGDAFRVNPRSDQRVVRLFAVIFVFLAFTSLAYDVFTVIVRYADRTTFNDGSTSGTCFITGQIISVGTGAAFACRRIEILAIGIAAGSFAAGNGSLLETAAILAFQTGNAGSGAAFLSGGAGFQSTRANVRNGRSAPLTRAGR